MDLSSQLVTGASGIHQVHYWIACAPCGIACRNLPLLQPCHDFCLVLQKKVVRNAEENILQSCQWSEWLDFSFLVHVGQGLKSPSVWAGHQTSWPTRPSQHFVLTFITQIRKETSTPYARCKSLQQFSFQHYTPGFGSQPDCALWNL